MQFLFNEQTRAGLTVRTEIIPVFLIFFFVAKIENDIWVH